MAASMQLIRKQAIQWWLSRNRSADDAVKIDQGAEGNDPQQNGTGWAIRKDGTFVNRLDADLVAQGTKLWENIPGNVSQNDLPAVTIYLQQKLASDDTWPEAYATQNSDGTWKFRVLLPRLISS